MNHFTFEKKASYRVCFLVNKIQMSEISKEYLKHLSIPKEDVLIMDLFKDPNKKKTSAALMKEYLEEVEDSLYDFNVEYVVVCNSDYYKTFTKQLKADVNIGYLKPVDKYKVIYCPDYKAIFYDPDRTRSKIKRSLEAINNDLKGAYQHPDKLSFKAFYPRSEEEIVDALSKLLKLPAVTCDIETFSLRPHEAGIASIGFALNQGEGFSFKVDLSPSERNEGVREILRQWFEAYQGTLIFHNIAFDASVLIYQLYMDDITDNKGLLEGMEVLLKNFDDTKLIAYLATNSCAGNELGLKALAHEFAGNWAQEEIGNIQAVPEETLLEYNVIDCLATWFVHDKYKPIMIKDKQEGIYKNLFIPATRDIIHMQLTGFPLDMDRVLEVEKELQKESDDALKTVMDSSLVRNFVDILKQEWVIKRNQELKKKRVSIEDATAVEFNPRSHPQLQRLLYEAMHLPIINQTDTNQPATDADTLKALINHTENQEHKRILQGLIDFAAVDKILGTFIVAMKSATYSPKMDWYFLTGNFNLGGTVSGRLSSNRPNLQNLPATGSKYAKTIKSCFKAPEGWLMVGLDFNALEDHISALLTKDRNKLKVYTDHYDGHCLRAYSYFSDQMPDITEELEKHPEKEVEIINSIKHKYKDIRQKSKGPTFALTYAGSYKALMDIFGFSKEEALNIESKYHELYRESDEWVSRKMQKAAIDGYVEVAFGLRVRTPVMHQCVLGLRATPKEAEAEKRTAGNALGQSYGLLNSRAGVEFNSRVRGSKYRNDIRPVAQIHDAQYFLIKNDVDVILWANKYLVKAVSWQDDPAIWHEEVKLGGEFSIFYPDWAHELSLPNDLTETKLEELTKEYQRTL